MTASTKPPFPTETFAPWPRIAVDRAAADFEAIRRAATFAADGLMFSPDAPSRTAPLAQQVSAAVEESLLYLLEMGLIDIDAERLGQYLDRPHPPYREGR